MRAWEFDDSYFRPLRVEGLTWEEVGEGGVVLRAPGRPDFTFDGRALARMSRETLAGMLYHWWHSRDWPPRWLGWD